jgi:regulator of protease activity HflC (stomatin/prohibitin superfamily)
VGAARDDPLHKADRGAIGQRRGGRGAAGCEAALAEAQSSRQVAILEARAKKESAVSLAEAEVIRAEGAAKANQILQNSLGGPEGYLRYLQIQALEDSKAQLIYVPTEAGLPVTEARRLAPAE